MSNVGLNRPNVPCVESFQLTSHRSTSASGRSTTTARKRPLRSMSSAESSWRPSSSTTVHRCRVTPLRRSISCKAWQPTPVNIWNVEIRDRAGLLTTYSEQEVRLALLPQADVIVTREGIQLGACFYSAPEILERGCLSRQETTDSSCVPLMTCGWWTPSISMTNSAPTTTSKRICSKNARTSVARATAKSKR